MTKMPPKNIISPFGRSVKSGELLIRRGSLLIKLCDRIDNEETTEGFDKNGMPLLPPFESEAAAREYMRSGPRALEKTNKALELRVEGFYPLPDDFRLIGVPFKDYGAQPIAWKISVWKTVKKGKQKVKKQIGYL